MADNNIELVGLTIDTSGVQSAVTETANAMERLNFVNQRTAEEGRKLAAVHEQIAQRTREARSGLDAYMQKLSEQAETVSMTAEQLAVYRARMLGATEAEAQHAAALARSIEAQKNSASSLDKLGSMFGRVAERALMYGAIYGVIRAGEDVIRGVVEQTEKDEQANARLEAVLKATGNAAGVTATQLRDMALATEKSTLFNAQDIKNAEATLVTFKNIQGDVFNQVLRMSADVASEKGGDLVSWATRLGRAFNDPKVGLTQLTRVGIQFTDEEREQIKTLQEHNQLAEAQAIIYDKLVGSFGGAAEAMHTGLSGATHDVTVAWHELLIELGKTDLVSHTVVGALNFIARGLEALKTVHTPAAELSEQLDKANNAETGFENQLMSGTNMTGDQMRGIRQAARAGSVPASPIMLSSGVQFDFEGYRQAVQAVDSLQKKLQDLSHTVDKPAPKPPKPVHEDSQELIQYLDRLKEEKDELGMTAGQKAYYTAITDGATEAEARHAAAMATSIDNAKKAAEATKQRASALEALIKRTHEQLQVAQVADKGGLTEKQVVLGQASQDGASAGQLRALGIELDETAALKEQDEVRKKVAATIAEQTRATDSYIERLNEEVAALRSGTQANEERAKALVGASDAQKAQIAQQEAYLNYLKERNKASQEAARQDAKNAADFEKAWEGGLDSTAADFGKFFTDSIEGKKQTWRAFTDNLLETWIHTLTKMEEAALDAKILQIIASLRGPNITPSQSSEGFDLGSLGPAEAAPAVPTFHSGGIVGDAGAVSRAVALSTFAHAPRLHSGLAPDEYPAVLQKGEAVVTAQQMASAKSAAAPQQLVVHQEQHFHFQGIDGRDIERMLYEHKGTIAGITADAARSSFAFRQQLAGQRA